MTCPFCAPAAGRIFHRDSLVIGIWDGYPVSRGHALLIPVRHVATWFDATLEERDALMRATDVARMAIEATGPIDGYNVGINIGAAAGQTVFHLHVHVIPRRAGDTPDPRGGVRHVFPKLANYVRDSATELLAPYVNSAAPKTLWTGGESDPLLPQLKERLSRAKAADIVVAFTLRSGVEQLFPYLQDLLNRKGSLRLMTGDYLGASDPDALIRLLDLQGNVQCRVFQTDKSLAPGSRTRSFHPKAYLLRAPDGACAAFIGSSNLSLTALTDGVEWNYRVLRTADDAEWIQIQSAFDTVFSSPHSLELTVEWIEGYRQRRSSVLPNAAAEIEPDPPASTPTPHAIQAEALEALCA